MDPHWSISKYIQGLTLETRQSFLTYSIQALGKRVSCCRLNQINAAAAAPSCNVETTSQKLLYYKVVVEDGSIKSISIQSHIKHWWSYSKVDNGTVIKSYQTSSLHLQTTSISKIRLTTLLISEVEVFSLSKKNICGDKENLQTGMDMNPNRIKKHIYK